MAYEINIPVQAMKMLVETTVAYQANPERKSRMYSVRHPNEPTISFVRKVFNGPLTLYACNKYAATEIVLPFEAYDLKGEMCYETPKFEGVIIAGHAECLALANAMKSCGKSKMLTMNSETLGPKTYLQLVLDGGESSRIIGLDPEVLTKYSCRSDLVRRALEAACDPQPLMDGEKESSGLFPNRFPAFMTTKKQKSAWAVEQFRRAYRFSKIRSADYPNMEVRYTQMGAYLDSPSD